MYSIHGRNTECFHAHEDFKVAIEDEIPKVEQDLLRSGSNRGWGHGSRVRAGGYGPSLIDFKMRTPYYTEDSFKES